MARKARHDVAGMHGKAIVSSNGIPALTQDELAEFIDAPEPIGANFGPDELDEERGPSRMIEGSSPPLGAS